MNDKAVGRIHTLLSYKKIKLKLFNKGRCYLWAYFTSYLPNKSLVLLKDLWEQQHRCLPHQQYTSWHDVVHHQTVPLFYLLRLSKDILFALSLAIAKEIRTCTLLFFLSLELNTGYLEVKLCTCTVVKFVELIQIDNVFSHATW